HLHVHRKRALPVRELALHEAARRKIDGFEQTGVDTAILGRGQTLHQSGEHRVGQKVLALAIWRTSEHSGRVWRNCRRMLDEPLGHGLWPPHRWHWAVGGQLLGIGLVGGNRMGEMSQAISNKLVSGGQARPQLWPQIGLFGTITQ